MKKPHAAAIIALCSLLAGCEPYWNGNGQPATESRALEGFDDVDSEGPFDVRVEQGDVYRVIVTIDSNLLHALETRVVNRSLRITSSGHLGARVRGPNVIVTMPHITSATLSGSGRLDVFAVHTTDAVHVRLSGSGEIDFQGTAPAIDARLDGSGDINLAGSADRITLALLGSGALDAAGMPALSGSIDLSGSGEVRATVNGVVDVALGGSGDVDIYGNAELGHVSKSGSGSIRMHGSR
jgi:hypothetical protein